MDDKIAQRVKVNTQADGGIESLIDKVAYVASIFGAISAVITLSVGEISFGLKLFAALKVAIGTVVLFVCLRGLSEIIRLLKHSNNLPYGGSLSHVDDTTSYVCGDCGAPVYLWEKCEQCGATLNKDH